MITSGVCGELFPGSGPETTSSPDRLPFLENFRGMVPWENRQR
jgi:hypothetical protein